MMTIKNDLQNIVSDAGTMLTQGNLFVKPIADIGVGGWYFSKMVDTNINLKANITTHYNELGQPISDGITKEPLQFTMNGFVGELTIARQKVRATLAKVGREVGSFNTLVSKATTGAQQLQKLWLSNNPIEGVLNQTAGKLFDSYAIARGIIPVETTIGKAFYFFQLMQKLNILLSVHTFAGTFNNMFITDLQAIQDGNTNEFADFRVEFTQYLFYETPVSDVYSNTARTATQVAKEVVHGNIAVGNVISNLV